MKNLVILTLVVLSLCACNRNDSMSGISLFSEATQVSDLSTVTVLLGGPLTEADDGVTASVVIYQLENLWFPSGRVLASDGFIMDGDPFDRSIAPGRYPLQLVVARFGDDERIALAILRVSQAPVKKWVMAITRGQDLATLKKDEIFGYGVDSGTGSFCDLSARNLINQINGPDMAFFNRIEAEMRKVYKHTRDWVHIETAQGSAVLFSSGGGDGFYASYFGLDDAGNVAALMTDFQILDWPRRP